MLHAVRRIAGVITVGGMIGAVTLALACETASHIYTGRLYVENRGCLGTESSVDVVDGDDTGSCAPICIVRVNASLDSGRAVYVSTHCGPYPSGFDTSGTDPGCAGALAALQRNDTCFSDGGSSHPVPPAPPLDASAD